MAYLYETHLHTYQGSACGRSTGAEHARAYKDLGYRGIFVTDHFFGGNTAVVRDLPWRARIERFCAGYEDAREAGARVGLDVFFGWEQGFGDDEYLVYGLDKAWLLEHPEMETWTRRQQLEGVHRNGGCVVQAHPFRVRPYIRHVRLGLTFCDAVEVANAGNERQHDRLARRYAECYGLPMIAGSDNHDAYRIQARSDKAYGISLDTPLRDERDFVRRILCREPIGLHAPKERFLPPDESEPEIRSHFLLEDETLSDEGFEG